MDEQRTVVTEADTTSDGVVQRERVSRSAGGSTLISRIVWFIAGFIIVVLALRIMLLLLAANQGNPFVDFVYAVSYPFAWPFFGIFSYTPSYGVVVFEISSLVAIAIYALVAWGIGKLLTLDRPTAAV